MVVDDHLFQQGKDISVEVGAVHLDPRLDAESGLRH
jgi:hypothetical protein